MSVLQVRVTEEQKAQMEWMASQAGVSVSELVRRLVFSEERAAESQALESRVARLEELAGL